VFLQRLSRGADAPPSARRRWGRGPHHANRDRYSRPPPSPPRGVTP